MTAKKSERNKPEGTGKRATERALVVNLAVGGSLAIGALVATLLPTSKTERRLTRPVGQRLIGMGRNSVRAAKSAAAAEFASVPLNGDDAAAQISRVVERVSEEAIA